MQHIIPHIHSFFSILEMEAMKSGSKWYCMTQQTEKKGRAGELWGRGGSTSQNNIPQLLVGHDVLIQ